MFPRVWHPRVVSRTLMVEVTNHYMGVAACTENHKVGWDLVVVMAHNMDVDSDLLCSCGCIRASSGQNRNRSKVHKMS
jgi:hypothetical protein